MAALCRNLTDLRFHLYSEAFTHEPHVAMWADQVIVPKDGANLTEVSPSGESDAQEISATYQRHLYSAVEGVA